MKIGLFGCGAYGMSLSDILIENDCDITIWTKFEKEKQQLEKTRQNAKLIPNFKISEKIKITTNIEECIKGKDLLIIAIPSSFFASVIQEMKPFIREEPILIATKGIEQGTCLFMNQILEKYIDTKNIAVISGPSFAIDLVSKKPAGLSLASKNKKTIRIVQKCLQNKYLKLKVTDDILGVEICGSIKNVIALASGILDGLEANESTKAMFLTEAIHDLKELLYLLGADKKTALSFSGIGDLFLTCSSTKSRNFSFGKKIGQKEKQEDLDKYLKNTTVEGVYTLKSIHKLLKHKNIKIPLIELIYKIVLDNKDPEQLLTFLVEK